MGVFLGIDTSNYTTSMAVCDSKGILLNEKILLEVKEGERGLRQSDAVFAHINNLPIVAERIGKQDVIAIGVSSKPRDIEGSYMPCFKAGESFADSLGSIIGVPVYKFSHQNGHVCAAAYSADRMDLLTKKFNAFHVSGGTTEILLCDGTDGKLKIENIGGTLDLNAGQAIDRTGVLLGLKFPCGPALEQLALNGKLPEKPKICVKGLNCNLSGLENKVMRFKEMGVSNEDIALYALKYVEITLDKLTENLRTEYNLPIIFAGGVMSNGEIKKVLSKYNDSFFAERAFSADNAAGIALLARDAYYIGK
ncbi:MAG: peptidase M22 [Clostridia bacterium]|nr:peptidase M22 [Clostridia bacterium]